MTIFADPVHSGSIGVTSAAASYAPVILSRSFTFGGASGTQTFVFPADTININANLYITANGSTATTDKITVSAAGTNLITFTSMGSAGGLVEVTTVALGTKTVIASACAGLGTSEVSAAVTFVTTDLAAQYQLNLFFQRKRTPSET